VEISDDAPDYQEFSARADWLRWLLCPRYDQTAAELAGRER